MHACLHGCRFIELVGYMARQGLLEKLRLVPLLVGVANDAYASGLQEELRRAAPGAVIRSQFMGPTELAEVFRKTRINFHPPTCVRPPPPPRQQACVCAYVARKLGGQAGKTSFLEQRMGAMEARQMQSVRTVCHSTSAELHQSLSELALWCTPPNRRYDAYGMTIVEAASQVGAACTAMPCSVRRGATFAAATLSASDRVRTLPLHARLLSSRTCSAVCA